MSRSHSLPGLNDDYISQYFTNDWVTKQDDPERHWKVQRCWADEEFDTLSLLPGQEFHPLDRPLLRGEVGISDLQTGDLLIVPESSVTLFTRDFMKNDLVKRSLTAVESAIVTDIRTEVKLKHAISGEKIDAWVPADKVENALKVEINDRVVFGEWIGTVFEILESGMIEDKDGRISHTKNFSGVLEPGKMMPHPEIFANPATFRSPQLGNPLSVRNLEVRPLIIYVQWNAINQQIAISEQDKYPKPPSFWHGDDAAKLTYFDSPQSPVRSPLLGSVVEFVNQAEQEAYGGRSTIHDNGTFSFGGYKVTETRSTLSLRWQDGRENTEDSKNLVPYHNIDDYESWPGEYLVWRGENGERRPAVTQSFNPYQRVAEILFMDSREVQLVPALELDPGGPGKESYAVGFGQQVLLCSDNGVPPPEVPTLGDFHMPVNAAIWTEEIAKIVEDRSVSQGRHPTRSSLGGRSSIDWFGEVVDLHLDGTVSVLLGNGKTKRVQLKEVISLADAVGLEAEDSTTDENMPMEDIEQGLESGPLSYSTMVGPQSDASWETLSEDRDDWDAAEAEEFMEESMDIDDQDDEGDVELSAVPSDSIGSGVLTRIPKESVTVSNGSSSVSLPNALAGPSKSIAPPNGYKISRPALTDGEAWRQFDVLSEAPNDHHFFLRKPSLQAPGKSYYTRLQKEHRALASSLPENILVRTYENRTDLMRCLIIGPEGTPYADAPFIFDIYLDPTKFPYEPPAVYFHSHTNGHGRCNPNLYEDGMVCLSILGTWAGEKSESWSASQSSLLQVLVSISGLVLVKSPYHCEPAFAKFEGTKEGKINSRLYSEKAYVLSRSFVKTALERPPKGLENEIRSLYFDKGRLHSVISHAKRLIELGEMTQKDDSASQEIEEDEEMWNADAMGSLSLGAILSLKRTISALETKLKEHL